MTKTDLGPIYKTNGASPVPFITVHRGLIRLNKLAYRMIGAPAKAAISVSSTSPKVENFLVVWCGQALKSMPYWREAARSCVPDARKGVVMAIHGIGEMTPRGRYYPVSDGRQKTGKYIFKFKEKK